MKEKYRLVYFDGDGKNLYELYFDLWKLAPMSVGHGGSFSHRTGFGIDADTVTSVSVAYRASQHEEVLKLMAKHNVVFDPVITPTPLEFEVER